MQILYVAAAAFLVGTLITIHEFGHFLVARFFGVTVKVFSIGFGKRLFGFQWRGTDYRVSSIPFGGYVRWVGADPYGDSGADDDEWMDAKGSFIHKPAWQRLLILLAGPGTNLLLPVVVFTALMFAGEPQPRSDVGRVEHGSVAEQLGVRPGDRIVGVNGVRLTTWVDVLEAFDDDQADPVEIVVDRAGSEVAFVLAKPDVELPLRPWDYGIDNNSPDPTVIVDDGQSPAGLAGFKSGDVIVSVDGIPVRTWIELSALLATSERAEVVVQRVDPANKEVPITTSIILTPLPTWAPAGVAVDEVLWQRFGLASATLGVGSISKDSAAAKAGIQHGDRLLRVGAHEVYSWVDVVRGVSDSTKGKHEGAGADPVEILVRRDGVVSSIWVTPDVVEDTDDFGRYRVRPLAGIGGGGAWVNGPMVPRPYPLWEAFPRAVDETVAIGGFILEQVGLLFTGGAAVSKSLGGPVEIFRQAKMAAERGLFDYARLMGQLSISLGVLNLLPIPVLDGGSIAMYTAEWIRGRRLPERVRERLQQVGLLFLVTLILFVAVFDIHRWVTTWMAPS